MNDFESLIGKMLADGKTPEEIAAIMTNALNKAEEQKKEADQKTNKARYIEGLKKTFNDRRNKNENLIDQDAAAVVTIVAASDPAYADIFETSNDVEAYYEFVKNGIHDLPNSFKTIQRLRRAASRAEKKADESLFTPMLDVLFGTDWKKKN